MPHDETTPNPPSSDPSGSRPTEPIAPTAGAERAAAGTPPPRRDWRERAGGDFARTVGALGILLGGLGLFLLGIGHLVDDGDRHHMRVRPGAGELRRGPHMRDELRRSCWGERRRSDPPGMRGDGRFGEWRDQGGPTPSEPDADANQLR